MQDDHIFISYENTLNGSNRITNGNLPIWNYTYHTTFLVTFLILDFSIDLHHHETFEMIY